MIKTKFNKILLWHCSGISY